MRLEQPPASRVPAPPSSSAVTGRCANRTPNHSADLGVVGMVGDHHRDVDRELTPTRPGQQVDEAVRFLRHQHADARDVVARNAPRTACRSVRRSAGTPARSRRARGRSPSSRNSTRWKNTPSVRSVCCCASTMLPPWRSTNSATAATMPGRSAQVSSSTAVAMRPDRSAEGSVEVAGPEPSRSSVT